MEEKIHLYHPTCRSHAFMISKRAIHSRWFAKFFFHHLLVSFLRGWTCIIKQHLLDDVSLHFNMKVMMKAEHHTGRNMNDETSKTHIRFLSLTLTPEDENSRLSSSSFYLCCFPGIHVLGI